MARDIHGRPQRSAAEPMRYGASGDKDNKSTTRRAKEATDPDDMLQNHHDRLARIEEHLGLAKPRDGFKDEDQGGRPRTPIGKGHDTEKGGKEYAHFEDKGGKMAERKRH